MGWLCYIDGESSNLRWRNVSLLFLGWSDFAKSGGTITYEPNLKVVFQRLAIYVDKILKGANPGELAVEQPTKFELVINLKAAGVPALAASPPLDLQLEQFARTSKVAGSRLSPSPFPLPQRVPCLFRCSADAIFAICSIVTK